MTATWPDLTARLDPIHRRALQSVSNAAEVVGVDWFLTGAMARDWIFTLMHGMDTLRATRDADVGIALAGWDEFEHIRSEIIEGGVFVATRSLHRLDHRQLPGFHVDLIPFGKIGGENAEIAWPPSRDVVLNVIGFEEAFRAAMTVLADVGLPVKVASPAGLMLMKFFAWEDRKYLQPPGKDAMDIRLLLTRYETVAGRSLWGAGGVMEVEEYDAPKAAARLLGRDVRAILSPACHASLMPILDRELAADDGSLLLEQLARGRMTAGSISDEFRTMRALLASFRSGLDDRAFGKSQ